MADITVFSTEPCSFCTSANALLDRRRIEPIVADLREFARELAPARDAEVLAVRIHAGLAELEPELLLGPVQAQTTRHFARAEAEAGAAVLSALDGPRYARLRSDLEQLVVMLVTTGEVIDRMGAVRVSCRW